MKEQGLENNIPMLFCRIRCIEFILHTDYEIEIRKWHVISIEDKNLSSYGRNIFKLKSKTNCTKQWINVKLVMAMLLAGTQREGHFKARIYFP